MRMLPKLRTTAGSLRTSKRELMATWSLPRVMTRGKKELRVSVIGYDSCTTGVNCSIFGYISSGEMVPEVMTTLLKRSKTGWMASEGSRQAKWKIGFGTVALSVSKGSRMRMKPKGSVQWWVVEEFLVVEEIVMREDDQ